jgi:hypothetical protein
MKLPNSELFPGRVVRMIFAEGGSATKGGILKKIIFARPSYLDRALQSLIKTGHVTKQGEQYVITEEANELLKANQARIQMATSSLPPIKPWSGKYNLPKSAPRHDAQPLRDISFVCASPAASEYWSTK